MKCKAINSTGFGATMKIKSFYPSHKKEAKRLSHIAELFKRETAFYPNDFIELDLLHNKSFSGNFIIGDESYYIGLVNDVRGVKNPKEDFWKLSDEKIAKSFAGIIEVVKKTTQFNKNLRKHVGTIIVQKFSEKQQAKMMSDLVKAINTGLERDLYTNLSKDSVFKEFLDFKKTS